MIFIQTIVLVSALLHIFGIEVDVAEGRSLRHVHSPEHYLANAFHTNAVLANPYPVIPASNLSPWAPGLLGGVINQPELTGPSYNTLGNGISANTAAVFNGIDGALTDPLGSYNLPGVPLGFFGMGMGGLGMTGLGGLGLGGVGLNPNLVYLTQQLTQAEHALRQLLSTTEHLQTTRDVAASMSGLATPMGSGMGPGAMAMGGIGGLGMGGYGMGRMV